MKILVIQQKMIGDVLTTSILFEALKQKYPISELHYAINSHTYPVVENNPFIDRFVFISPEMEKNKLKFFSFLKTIKKERYDVVIDVYNKISSNLISLFSNAKNKISYHKKYTSFIYDCSIKRLKQPENNASLAIENRFKLLESLEIEYTNILPKVYLTKKEVEGSKHFLEAHNIMIGNPLFMISVLGSSKKKTYPLQYMAALIDKIADVEDSQILFNYLPNQKEHAKQVFDSCKPDTKKQIFLNVFGKSLREFLAITYHCKALIGNEGGATNMAKAMQIPTFTIFSPYLNKKNWFGENETKKHVALHLSDFISYSEKDLSNAKESPETYYLKFKPKFIIPYLKAFLSNEL